jgi:hypothetical protein
MGDSAPLPPSSAEDESLAILEEKCRERLGEADRLLRRAYADTHPEDVPVDVLAWLNPEPGTWRPREEFVQAVERTNEVLRGDP